MIRYVALVSVLCLVVGCGAEPTPTPDLVATQIAVEKAAHATMTAEAPTATATPESPTAEAPMATVTPESATAEPPRDTPTPTIEPSNTASPTSAPTPSETPMPTIIPVRVPEDWKVYEHFSRRFNIAYPPDWTVKDEGKSMVTLSVSTYSLLTVGLSDVECGINYDPNPQEALSCLAVNTADMVSSLDTFQLIGTDLWDDGVHQGYVVESRVEDYVYDIWTAQMFVFIPIRDDPGVMIAALYGRAGTQNLTNQERSMLHEVIGSFRLGIRADNQTIPGGQEGARAPTATKVASIDPTSTTADPVVIQDVSEYVTVFDDYRLEGVVANHSNQNIRRVRLVGTFRDAQGQLVKTEEVYAQPLIVEGGGMSTFSFVLRDPPRPIDSYELEMAGYEQATDELLTVDVVWHEGSMSDNIRYKILGEVHNPHPFALEWVFIYAICYDSTEALVAIKQTSTDLDTVEADRSSTFELTLVDPPREIDHCAFVTTAIRK